ncbi:MAG: DUF4252 domain-containing protein [Muribaculaceae bacterium]|nr:DUF4252 domain-containing protein [Muribaculaceae bacterium]
MKKLLVFLLSTVLLASCGMLSHNADDIMNDMRDARHAQYFNVGSGLLGIGRLLSPTLAEASLGITSVQVLDLSKCNANVREKFRKRLQRLYDNRSYESIVTTQSGYDTKSALIRRDGQYVSEIVLANASDMNDVMVLIFGHINLENIERIVNDQRNYLIK